MRVEFLSGLFAANVKKSAIGKFIDFFTSVSKITIPRLKSIGVLNPAAQIIIQSSASAGGNNRLYDYRLPANNFLIRLYKNARRFSAVV